MAGNPYIRDDREAQIVANAIANGQLVGEDKDRAMAGLRAYTASKGQDPHIPVYHAGLGDVAREIEQGASYQWLPSKGDTEDRAKAEIYAQHHPLGAAGLQAAGGAGTAAAAVYGLRQLAKHAPNSKIGRAAAVLSMAGASKDPLTNWQMMKRAAPLGGVAGAISGAGSTPSYDPGEMATQAGEQGIIGTLTAPLAALGVKYGITQPLGWLINKIRGVEPTAGGRKVIAALRGDQTTPQQVQADLNAANRAGVPTTVADVGGPRTQALAQAAAAKPGPTVDKMVEDLTQRQAGASGRVADLINKFLKPDPYWTKMDELTNNLYSKAKPLYDKAYKAFPALKSDTITQILGTKWGSKAGQEAEALMEADGVPLGKPGSTNFSLQYLDYVKRALDDQISSAERGGNNNLGRVLRGMRNRLRDELDLRTKGPQGQPSPYTEARGTYAGDLEIRDALQAGRENWLKMDPEQLRRQFAGMSFMEKDAFRSGVAESLFQKLANMSADANAAKGVLRNSGVAQRLQWMFDSPKEYKQFVTALEQEMDNFVRARNVITAGARGQVAAASKELDAPALSELGHAVGMGVSGHPVLAASSAARAVGNLLPPSGAAEQAAEILGRGGPQALTDIARQAGPWISRQNTGNLMNLGAIPGLTGAAEQSIMGRDPQNTIMAPPPITPAHRTGGHVRRSRSRGGATPATRNG